MISWLLLIYFLKACSLNHEKLSNGSPLSFEFKNNPSIRIFSCQGKLLIADQSGHFIHLDQPELVVQAIREVFKPIVAGPNACCERPTE